MTAAEIVAGLVKPELLREFLRYDPETGLLSWNVRDRRHFPDLRSMAAWNARYAGKQAFQIADPKGYLRGTILGKRVQTHRAIWCLVHGEMPSGDVDHINGDRSDNRLVNLRLATRSQNLRNRRSKAGSTSKFLGVSWNARRKKWAAQICADRINRQIGYFSDEEDAARAYDAAAISIHGEFARLNFPALSAFRGAA